MSVLAIWRHPIKAMLGEFVESVEVGHGGLAGDRRWIVADLVTGRRIADKRGPSDERLRECRARIGDDGELVVTLAGGGTDVIGVAAATGALSELPGRRMALIEHGGGGDRFGRTSGHHDFAPVHVMTPAPSRDARDLARVRLRRPPGPTESGHRWLPAGGSSPSGRCSDVSCGPPSSPGTPGGLEVRPPG